MFYFYVQGTGWTEWYRVKSLVGIKTWKRGVLNSKKLNLIEKLRPTLYPRTNTLYQNPVQSTRKCQMWKTLVSKVHNPKGRSKPMTQIKTTVLPAGPTKRVWVNKHHLPQFGGTSPTSPVWEVECEGQRYSGYWVWLEGMAWCIYDPEQPEHGPHAWLMTIGELRIDTAAEEAA